jgi:hypothetical protein
MGNESILAFNALADISNHPRGGSRRNRSASEKGSTPRQQVCKPCLRYETWCLTRPSLQLPACAIERLGGHDVLIKVLQYIDGPHQRSCLPSAVVRFYARAGRGPCGSSRPTPVRCPNKAASLARSASGSGGLSREATLLRRWSALPVPNNTTSTPGSCRA